MKYTVITGASSGIGYETALAFANKDKNLILVARRLDRLESLKEKITYENSELSVIVKTADLSKKEEVFELYEDLSAYDIETWINDAGTGDSGFIIDQELDSIERMIDLNVEATTLLSTLYAKDYSDVPGAQLINVSSAMGYVVSLGNVAYSASKFFVSVFTEGLAHELKGKELKAKIFAPGLTLTDFVSGAISETDAESGQFMLHTAKEVAGYLIQLYESDKIVGIVDEKNEFVLRDPVFPTLSL